MQAFTLTELIALPLLHQLQKSLASITGFSVQLISPEGVSVAQAPQRKHMLVYKELCAENLLTGKPAMQTKSGVVVYAVPINIDGKYMGSWMIEREGPMHMDEQARILPHIEAINGLIAAISHAAKQQAYAQGHEKFLGNDQKALIQSLGKTLHSAHEASEKLSIALINIDGLAYANSAYGHPFGDMLVKSTAESLRAVIRSNDIIGKMHEDTLVMVLPGCSRKLAEKRIWQGKEKLGQIKLLGSTEVFSFNFGLVENNELQYEEDALYVIRLLAIAEKRMFENRRALQLSYTGV